MTTAQLIGPLYLGTAAFSSSWSCVLTYSVGKVIMISRPPEIPPIGKREKEGERKREKNGREREGGGSEQEEHTCIYHLG